MTYRLNTTLCALLLAMLTTGNTIAANIVSYLDRNPVSLDESFHLTLEADGKVDDSPDLSVLEKDFDIINTSQSSNMSFVNGKVSQKLVWTITLIGKQAGVFTIPTISFGNDRSPALRVTINSSSSPATGQSSARHKDIFMEVELDKKSAWVQSQLIYSIRIFHSVGLNNPSLSQLRTSDNDAIIERLGDTKNYEAFRNGIRYQVSELRFAVYPQRSGNITFNPVLLEGRVSLSRSQSLFDQFLGGGRIKRVRSESLSATIKPRPDDIQLKNWLPASQVTLKEEWSEDIQKLKVGEPVTRTITLTADGQMATYLPDLELQEMDGIKQYPDKPVQNDTPTEKGMTGNRQIKIAMIPTRTGSYKLPALSLPWWNTTTGKKEIARLPEVLLNVSGAVSGARPPAGNSDQNLQATTTENSRIPVEIPQNNTADKWASYWPMISLILATGWLITLVAYIRKQPVATSKAEKEINTRSKPVKPLEQDVLKQCNLNNAQQTKDALLAWAKARWPDRNTTSLADIAQLSAPALRDAIMSLNTALYSSRNKNWSGKSLSESFTAHKNQSQKNHASGTSLLEPLYKN